jgi:hypothetical protein
MEPILIAALGIVVYCVYLTAKDLLFDLRSEGILRSPAPGGSFARSWKNNAVRFFRSQTAPQRAWRPSNSFGLVLCRPVPSYSRQHMPAESRLYAIRTR